MGPTACGKSALAKKLKKLLPVELVSVDSALIYRDMNIGTAKPTSLELFHYPYYLINIKDPKDGYSASEFQKDVLKIIKRIIYAGKIPLLVGGTMFYFKTLLEGLPELPEPNFEFRSYLCSLAQRKHRNFLHNMLKIVDFESSKRIHSNDLQRILRILEIFYMSGKTLTELTKFKKYKFPYKTLQFSIIPKSRNWLVEKILIRFEKMLLLGFQSEVENLLNRGDLNINLPSMRCVGYRQMWGYLTKVLSYDEMVQKSISATKKLAKNQLTWLNNWKNLNVLINNDNLDTLSYEIVKILEKLKL
ncbi:hypothetical protein XW81_02630 [Buchnera aphidicola (Schlechtendalia chinensis)]|uniref:tRNA dimethylallyltransferase n=1 Tax=Buchnera aphidicola subsp. Schlechtendalia chinensis TaxID=118110 RepID=A0A172WEI2_BUCSC|nr:tRNA (adenosine(37)-N6)-dimethylallyltransferase MiaA [Buchnera aphidicola]ANF17325.1 hypothetical protein XW81_02630 [Buchnera aphidicola (Schlechtendalia chinensis)]